MKLDLFKLNNNNYIEIDENIVFSEEYYKDMDIRDIKGVHVEGEIRINELDEVVVDLSVSGEFILPCAITLEDVSYEFATNIEENLGNFNDFYDKRQKTLDILPVLWENIVSEVPIRVVKEGVSVTNIHGDGWELVSD